MKVSDRLLKLDRLEVFKDVNNKVCVSYAGADIYDAGFLIGDCGRGVTFEEACENYLEKISGKTLVFNYNKDNEKKVIVL